MKKYIKPSTELLVLTDNEAILAASPSDEYTVTLSEIEITDVNSKEVGHNSLWDDED